MSETVPKVPFLPSSGKVILARNKVPDVIKGIAIPSQQRRLMEEQNIRAQVVAVGNPEIDNGVEIAFEWAVGDEVMIDSYSGRTLVLEGTDLVLTIARFGEVIGKFLEPEPEPAEMYTEAEPLLYVPEPVRIITP